MVAAAAAVPPDARTRPGPRNGNGIYSNEQHATARVLTHVARARAAAAGEAGREAAERELRAAVALEDAMAYMEPPYVHAPVRHCLGKQLLDAGRPGAAEEVYREDLARHPDNGWALLGLHQSLAAQRNHAEAQLVLARFQRAWRHADTLLASSCPAFHSGS